MRTVKNCWSKLDRWISTSTIFQLNWREMKAFNGSVMDFCNKGWFDMTPHCDVSDAMTPISSKWGQVARLKKLMNTFTKLIRPFPDLVNAKKPFSSQFSQLRSVSTQKQKKTPRINTKTFFVTPSYSLTRKSKFSDQFKTQARIKSSFSICRRLLY